MKTKLIVKRSRIAITCTRRRWSSWNIWSRIKVASWNTPATCATSGEVSDSAKSTLVGLNVRARYLKFPLQSIHYSSLITRFVTKPLSSSKKITKIFRATLREITDSRHEYAYYRQGGEREFHLFAVCDECLKKQQSRKANGLAIFWERA